MRGCVNGDGGGDDVLARERSRPQDEQVTSMAFEVCWACVHDASFVPHGPGRHKAKLLLWAQTCLCNRGIDRGR